MGYVAPFFISALVDHKVLLKTNKTKNFLLTASLSCVPGTTILAPCLGVAGTNGVHTVRTPRLCHESVHRVFVGQSHPLHSPSGGFGGGGFASFGEPSSQGSGRPSGVAVRVAGERWGTCMVQIRPLCVCPCCLQTLCSARNPLFNLFPRVACWHGRLLRYTGRWALCSSQPTLRTPNFRKSSITSPAVDHAGRSF